MVIILIGTLAGNLFAQTSATSTWPLTADENATVTGNLSAAPQTLSNMQVKYESGVQRSSPSGTAGSWPGESAENSSRYLQFAVTPDAGYIFNVTSIELKLYVNSGSNMRANVYYSTDPLFVNRTQIGSTYTLSSAAPSAPNVTATLNYEVAYGDTFYVRIYPWYTTSTTGKYVITNSVVISGTTIPSTYILVSPTVLNRFIQENAAIPSPTQTYFLSGKNLIDTVIVYPPPNFAISADDGETWIGSDDSLRLPVIDGNIVGQPLAIAVYLKANSPGEYSGTIEHKSGATITFVSVSGAFLANEPTVASAISADSVSGKTAILSSIGGNGARRVITIRPGTEITWLPEDGKAVGGVSSIFTEAIDQGDGTRIVYDGEDISVTVTGLNSNTTYTAAVFEYNVATGNTFNYLTDQYGAVTFTTAIVPELSVSPSALNFGSVLISQKLIKSYTLTGRHLIENDLIHIIAPLGFDLSLAPDTGFIPSLPIAYTTPSFDTTVYVRFTPTEPGVYSGFITNILGNDTITLAVFGRGVYTMVSNAEPVGFATLGGGTSGGQGGDSVIVTTAEQLNELMHSRENKSTSPLVVYISGTLSGYSSKIPIKRTANISIIGLDSGAGLNGFGIKIAECRNIIVRNLTFADCHVDEKDALEIDNCQNVWVDHCTFSDSPANDPSGSDHDGLLDIKNGSRNITVSYNYFTNHRQTCLLGHTDSQPSDTVMTVTYYRNWFDGTYSRHPRVRFARAHIVNNLYTNIGSYGVGVTCNAQVLVEANHFENTPTPILISQVNDPGQTLSGDPAGYVKALDNLTVNSGTIIENLSHYHFDPNDYYSYDVALVNMVKTLVMENAGAGRLDTNQLATRKIDIVPPNRFQLQPNYPNPFNAVTTIGFQIPVAGEVTLKAYDLLGREVATIFAGDKPAGQYRFTFDASNLPSGIYLYRLESGNFQQTRKMIILK
ncbi:MAG TPA: T9SS type A sorting domain-containing protein [Candidatus Marinimicrobia bacterium]|nr:T9SS type A sorting domain-containing protein [Candidatus Neomarinimicrobiota bacterium]HRS90703.1 T9SS type A sorting domain-containing protein [Candidatus Neomarinimicrobiota bacterium]